MSYTTQADLEARFGTPELIATADRDGDGLIDAAVVVQAILDADAEIDSYLGGRYTVPLAPPVPVLVQRLAADLARYRLQDDNPLDEVRERYARALATLRDLADGRATLQLADAPRAGFAVEISAPARQFTHDTLAGY